MEEIDFKQLAIHVIGYDPFNLPDNEFNNKHKYFVQVRSLFKLMLHVHSYILFPKMWSPDFGEHKGGRLPLTYDTEEIYKIRTGNCGTYSTYFEILAKALGFEVRHIGLINPDLVQGHWCSEVKVNKKWLFFDSMYINAPLISGYEIVENPFLLINNIVPIFHGIQEHTWLNLCKGLEINKEKSYDLGLENFIKKYYGVEEDEI